MHLDRNNSNLDGTKLCKLLHLLQLRLQLQLLSVRYCSEFIVAVCWRTSQACFKNRISIMKCLSTAVFLSKNQLQMNNKSDVQCGSLDYIKSVHRYILTLGFTPVLSLCGFKLRRSYRNFTSHPTLNEFPSLTYHFALYPEHSCQI